MDDGKVHPAGDRGLSGAHRRRGPKRDGGLLESLLRRLFWGFVRVYLKGYHRLQVLGRERLPTEAPFIIVANHASPLDVLAVAAGFPARLRVRLLPMVAGDAFLENLPISALALPLGSRHGDLADLEDMRRRLIDEPCGYLLFPEGTGTRTGEMASFKPGIGSLLASTLVPVVPCYLEGAIRAFPADKTFPRPRKLLLKVGAPLRFPATSNDQEGWTQIAATLEAAVRALKPTSPPAG